MPLSAGTRLGPYEILAPIGAGGMGEVYQARDTRLDRIVAVKVSQENFSERFEREAQAVAALNHPNICQLYDVGPNYLVMEFIEGSPVAPVDTSRKLLDLAVQIADGLAAAHAAGLIHRDLKPDNIMVTRDGRVKILDFGLAKTAATPAGNATRTIALTDPGTTIGTVNYMSPEQARGNTELSAQSDQFSLGLVLYELAAGKRAFERPSAAETLTAIIREDAEPLSAVTPAPLRWVIERLLSKEPADRYESTRDLYRELRHIRERLSQTSSAVEISAVTAPRRWRVWPFLATGAACLVAGVFLALVWLPSPPDLAALKFTPISRQDATERDPNWSPDGKSIAFTTNVHGMDQVFTKAIDSPDAAQITHSAAPCDAPFWSPDGSTIYYHSSNGMWAAPASGGTPDLVLDKVQAATIHPDGKTVAFIRERKLWVGPLKGGPPREFGKASFHDLRFARVRFSPDGSKLGVFGVGDAWWVLPYPSGTPRKMAKGSGLFDEMSWFPDNRHALLLEWRQSHGSTLSLTDTMDGSRRVIFRTAASILNSSVSPDGKRIAYSTGQLEWNVLEVTLPSATVRTVMAGSGVVSWWPDWAPAGTHYLVSTDRSGTPFIEDVSAAEGFSRRLILGASNEQAYAPRWAPDGSRFTFLSLEAGVLRLMLANSSGGRATPLDPDLGDHRLLGAPWSPDSQWVVYARTNAGKMQIVKIRAGAAASPIILAELDSAESPNWNNYPIVQWSPAGDWIVYPTRDGLSLISPDGKTTRKLTSRKLLVSGFSKDGAQLFGILRNTTGDGAQWQLFSVDVKTGADKLLGPVDLPASTDSLAGFSLHPDGKRFLTSIAKWPFHIWMMEGFDQPKSLVDRLLRR